MTAIGRGVIIGMDLGGTTLAGGLVDAEGTVQNSRTVPTDRLGRGEGVLQNLLEAVTGLADVARTLTRPLLGVGIGVPGVVEVDSGTIGEDIQNIPEFRGLALGRIIRESIHLPVVVDNDVNALMEPVTRWARFYAFEAAFDRTRIVRSILTKEAGVLGAAALFLYEERRGGAS